MACVDCPDCLTVNDGNIKIRGYIADWVKLHPCDITALITALACPPDANVLSFDRVETSVPGFFTIPAGFLHGSISIESGTATINGASRPTGYSLTLPPMNTCGGGNLLYPAYAITVITGIVHINYHTK